MAAYSAQLSQDPSGLDRLPDSSLYLRRVRYESDTRWAPPYAGRELRRVRMAQLDMTARQARHHGQADVAESRGDSETAARHKFLAASAFAAADFYQERRDLDEELDAARHEWRPAPHRCGSTPSRRTPCCADGASPPRATPICLAGTATG
jgi:hypothetical protein